MNNLIKLNVLGILILFLGVSCSKSNVDGDWGDIIKLSQKEVEINNENNSLILTAQGKGWWFDNIVFDGTNIDFSEINTTQDNFTIETPDFKIERKNSTEIHIDMNKNTTGNIRILNIYLQAGDYFDQIKITQLAN